MRGILRCSKYFFIFLVIIYLSICWFLEISLPNKELLSSDSLFTDEDSCPACFGTSLCPAFKKEEIKILGWSQYKLFSHFNIRNVYVAKYQVKTVILKKLGNKLQLKWLDDSICEKAGLPNGCEVASVIKILADNVSSSNIATSFINGISDLTKCPSRRLMELILDRMKEGDHFNRISILLTTLLMNPEPIFLQTFPPEGRWPFPSYIGACGRVVVVEYKGKQLTEFYHLPWIRRLKLASQLLDMAVTFTNNSMDFALYMTDVTHSNFAVDEDDKVWAIDTENIIVVDKLKIQEDKPNGWNKPHENLYHGCPDCLSFEETDLCRYAVTDHNVYVMCQGLLAPGAFSSPVEGGFLHSVPGDIEKRHNFTGMLNECADPSTPLGRLLVLPKLRNVISLLLQRYGRLIDVESPHKTDIL